MAQALTKGPTHEGPQYWETASSGCAGCAAGNCRTCNTYCRDEPVYDGAKKSVTWNPSNGSADAAALPDRDELAARSKDIVRNTGIGTSALNKHDDNIIGAHFRYSPKPIAKFLGWTHEESHDFMFQAKCLWKMDTQSSNKWFDAGGRKTPTMMLSQFYRTYMSHGDGVAAVEWLENRNSQFNTAMNIFDPLRIQTPDDLVDSPYVRQGVRVNRFGNPLGYFIYINHPYDELCSPYTDDRWDRRHRYVKARTDWGRPNIIHSFDQHFPQQTRGVPLFASAMKRLHMLDGWETQTLDAAIAQGTYAATIESDMPDAGMAIGQAGPMSQYSPSAQYFGEASQYLDKTNIYWDGVKVNRLYPGEKFTLHNPNQPIQSFDSFEWAMLRHVAVSLGVSVEDLIGDYSKVNYNGARASTMASWRHYQSQRVRICVEFANAMVEAWMEEQIANGRLQLPARIAEQYKTQRQRLNYFLKNKEALINCEWFGPGMGHIDPLKGTKAAQIEQQMGQLSGEQYQADIYSRDWDEHIDRMVYEEVIRAKKRKEAKERAKEMGCLDEFLELTQANTEAMAAADSATSDLDDRMTELEDTTESTQGDEQ